MGAKNKISNGFIKKNGVITAGFRRHIRISAGGKMR
jgi:hypothetical protein